MIAGAESFRMPSAVSVPRNHENAAMTSIANTICQPFPSFMGGTLREERG